MADDTNNLGTLGAAIPQLFFDIIAWLIPGAFVIVARDNETYEMPSSYSFKG
jgi:hypothetical protein